MARTEGGTAEGACYDGGEGVDGIPVTSIIDWPVLVILSQGWDTLGNIGAFLQGLATLIIAVGGAGAVYRYFQERDRQVVQDLVHTAGETATLARQRYERATATDSPDAATLLNELRAAEERQRAVLEGLMLRQELIKARYELVRTYVQDLTEKLEQERTRMEPGRGTPT